MPSRKLNIYLQRYSAGVELPNLRERRAVARLFPPAFKLDFKLIGSNVRGTGGGVVATIGRLRRATLDAPKRPLEEPWVHLVVARALSGRSKTYGVTYDSDSQVDAYFERRGCAVFVDPIRKEETVRGLGESELLARVVAHELGHVLNLDHVDAASESVMETPPTAALNGQALDRASNRNRLLKDAFSIGSRAHLCKHAPRHVYPGERPYGELEPGTDHPERKPPGRNLSSRGKAQLRLESFDPGRGYRQRGARIQSGEPLFLRSVLRNGRKQAFRDVPLDGDGAVDIQIQHQEEAGAPWTAAVHKIHACGAPPSHLGHGDRLLREHTLLRTFGTALERVHRGRLRAVVRLEGRWIVSEALPLRVDVPELRGLHAATRALRSQDVLEALVEGPLDCSTSAIRDLKAPFRRLPGDHPLRGLCSLTAGRELVRRLLDGDGGSQERRRASRELGAVAREDRFPDAMRQEARLWAARLARLRGEMNDARELVQAMLDEPQSSNSWLERASRELDRINKP